MVIQYSKYGIEIGKYQETILVEKENQLDLFIFLGQNSVRLKVICPRGRVYKVFLLILPLVLENTSTKLNCTDSALPEELNIQKCLRYKILHVCEIL